MSNNNRISRDLIFKLILKRIQQLKPTVICTFFHNIVKSILQYFIFNITKYVIIPALTISTGITQLSTDVG